jgi:hypothetical protein
MEAPRKDWRESGLCLVTSEKLRPQGDSYEEAPAT